MFNIFFNRRKPFFLFLSLQIDGFEVSDIEYIDNRGKQFITLLKFFHTNSIINLPIQ